MSDSEEYDGPRVQICRPDQVAKASRAYGLPVVSDDGYNHAAECFSCHGTANSDTCPRSVYLREYSERFRAGPDSTSPEPGPPAQDFGEMGRLHWCEFVEPDGATHGVCHLPGLHGGRGPATRDGAE